MTPAGTTSSPSTADVDAARLLLIRMGLSPQDLLDTAPTRPPVPTFAEYVPVVAAAVGPGTRRVYRSYWNRILDHWADRRLDDPTPSEIKHLVEHVKHNVVARRNARGGRCAGEHLISALRQRHAGGVPPQVRGLPVRRPPGDDEVLPHPAVLGERLLPGNLLGRRRGGRLRGRSRRRRRRIAGRR